jgi:hypothetical protein
MLPTKKYSELYKRIVPSLFNFFMHCDFCKHTGLTLRYYALEGNENLVCEKCYKKHHGKIWSNNQKILKNKIIHGMYSYNDIY